MPPSSLTHTLDKLNEAFFFNKPPSFSERRNAALYIASWQGKPGAYRNMFGMPPTDLAQPLRLFTGESVTSGAAKCHIVGEEACRALLLLGVDNPTVSDSLRKAQEGLNEGLQRHAEKGGSPGTYCCGPCSVGFWRHLLAGGMDDPQRRLDAGMDVLKKHRLPNGQWRRFPFFYTILALAEIASPQAIAEIRHAAPVCERYLRTIKIAEPYQGRRRLLMERALSIA